MAKATALEDSVMHNPARALPPRVLMAFQRVPESRSPIELLVGKSIEQGL